MATRAKPNDLLREEWNRLAKSYASRVSQVILKGYHALLPFLRLSEAQVVVEAACGPGHGLELLRQNLPATARILANDISARLVEIARAKEIDSVEVVEAVNEALPYADGVADRYVSSMSLHLVEFPEKMLAEAFRVLKPGSIAAISIFGDRSQCSITNIALQLIEKYASEQFRSPFHLSDLSTFKEIITSAGFRLVITFEEMCYLPALELVQLEAHLLRHTLVEGMYGGLEEGKKEAFRADLRALVHAEIEINQKPLGVQLRIAIAYKP
jgi:ubiquinone/menaquinone biosynthesis C-methylase UbiE